MDATLASLAGPVQFRRRRISESIRGPTPASEPVWTLRKGSKRVDCQLRFHGESYGWECVCLYDGELVHCRRFALKAGALTDAEAQRQRSIGEGWRASR